MGVRLAVPKSGGSAAGGAAAGGACGAGGAAGFNAGSNGQPGNAGSVSEGGTGGNGGNNDGEAVAGSGGTGGEGSDSADGGITGQGGDGSGFQNLTLINFYGLSPSGKYDSTKLVPNDVDSGVKRLQWAGFAPSGQTTKTLSFYAKAAGHNFVHGRVNTTGVCFNLSNGTTSIGFRDGSNQGTAATASSMEDVGNGWYRCIMTSNIATNFKHIYK